MRISNFIYENFWKIEISLTILAFSLLLFGFIIYPSYSSTKDYFSDNYSDILAEKSSGGLYSPSTDEITNFEEPGTLSYKTVQLHEICHRNQHYENRSKKGKVGVFLNEMECNFKGLAIWKYEENQTQINKLQIERRYKNE